MKRPRTVLVSCGILLAVGIVASLWAFKPREFRLSDGTRVAISGVSSGNQLQMFCGELWQRPLYLMLHKRFPSFFSKTTSACGSNFPGGSVGLAFIRFPELEAMPGKPNGSLLVSIRNGDGSEVWCTLRATHFKTKKLNGKTKVQAEHTLWELPPTNQRDLAVRFYHWDTEQRKTIFMEFNISNPCPRPAGGK
jgi:hypothetical protein